MRCASCPRARPGPGRVLGRSLGPIVCVVFPLIACTSEAPRSSTPVGGAEATHLASQVERDPQAELVFVAPDGWIVETPQSAMRKAQYRLPAAAGDAEDASLIVYFFGGGGGSIEDNLERWASQFEAEDGEPARDDMRVMNRTIAGLKATEAELSGTYVAETFPGSGERVNKPGWRMRAAIVESGHGPYYVKLVGPEATVQRWSASYARFLGTIE